VINKNIHCWIILKRLNHYHKIVKIKKGVNQILYNIIKNNKKNMINYIIMSRVKKKEINKNWILLNHWIKLMSKNHKNELLIKTKMNKSPKTSQNFP